MNVVIIDPLAIVALPREILHRCVCVCVRVCVCMCVCVASFGATKILVCCSILKF